MKVQMVLLVGAAVVMGGAMAVGMLRPLLTTAVPSRASSPATIISPSAPAHNVRQEALPASSQPSMHVSTTTITTTTTPVFSGTQVHIATGIHVSSMLPRNYPLSLNPVAFYQPQNYHLVFELQAILQGHRTTLQLFRGPANVTIATGWNQKVLGTYLANGTVQLTNLSGDHAYFSILDTNKTSWLAANLITGHMTISQVMPLAAELSPYIGGLPALYPVPEINPGSNPPARQSPAVTLPEPLIQQCLNEANQLFNTQVPASAVVLDHKGPHVDLIHVTPGRWKAIRFLAGKGPVVPQDVTTLWQGQTLRYHIATNSQGQATDVALSERQIQQITKKASTLPYSAEDSQAGAVAALPIDLAGYRALHPGAPKLLLETSHHTMLALTYSAQDHGHTVYMPIGWYWWQEKPQIFSPVPLPQATQTTPPPSMTRPSAPSS